MPLALAPLDPRSRLEVDSLRALQKRNTLQGPIGFVPLLTRASWRIGAGLAALNLMPVLTEVVLRYVLAAAAPSFGEDRLPIVDLLVTAVSFLML